jgi:hypothetical protein
MELLLVFAAGYVMGSRAGGESLDEVIEAVHAIRESDEFHDFVKAVRRHAAFSLRNLATVLERGREPTATPDGPTDLLDRVRLLVGRR